MLQIRALAAGLRPIGLGTMRGVNYSILRSCAMVLGACLSLSAAAADPRPPWFRAAAETGRAAPRWQASPALERILAQGRMSDAEREQLRRDLSATPRDRGRNGNTPRDARRDTRMTPQQRESLRRDMRDANRQLDRNPQRNNNGKRSGNGERRREQR